MFARMIYFRTAFESVGEIRIPANKPKPIYNQLVSRCLDVLYLVYSRDPGLTVVRWNKKEQLEKLQQPPVIDSVKNQVLEETIITVPIRTIQTDKSKIKEIAEKSGFSESKVKTVLHRTRKKLLQQLKEEGLC